MKRYNAKPSQFNQFKVQKGAGPVYNYNKSRPVPENLNTSQQVKKQLLINNVLCEGDIDNIVQYVYEKNVGGNHIGYVDCDYVE